VGPHLTFEARVQPGKGFSDGPTVSPQHWVALGSLPSVALPSTQCRTF